MSTEGFSRRSFLKGGALVGVAATIEALAGCTKPADPGKPADPAPVKGPHWSWSTPPAPIAEDKIAETKNVEVLIIGAGIAGSAAAMYSALQGHKTAVFQKVDTTATNGCFLGLWNSPYGDAKGVQWDIPADMQHFTTTYSNGRVNLKLFKRVMERTGEAAQFALNQTGQIHGEEPNVLVTGRHICLWWGNGEGFAGRYKGMRAFVARQMEVAQENGADVMFNTPGVQLIQDENGRIIGGIGQNQDGEYIRVYAEKGVLLATGDITDDEEMVECFCPLMKGIPSVHGWPCNTGDGHKMGMWVGARIDVAQHAVMMHYNPSPLSFDTPPFAAAPWLHVNIYGERFMNENVDYQTSANTVAMQPQHTAFQIIDKNYFVNVSKYKNGFRNGTVDAFNTSLEVGTIVQADTIADLAKAIDVDPDTLVKTVNRYNELVAKGVDEDFGMQSEYFTLSPILEAPFYALKRVPSKLASCGGLRCNDELQVVDNDDKVIPGLWAAGNVQGAMFGYDYPVTGFEGFSLGRSLTGGMLAIKSMYGTFDTPF